MTHTPHNSGDMSPDAGGMSHIDPELRSLVAGLDRLGAAGRAGPRAGFEDRLMQATLASLHGVEPVAVQAGELGAMDRASGPSDLEVDVFAESVPALRAAAPQVASPVLRHTGHDDRDDRRPVRVVRRVWWANQYVRLAAAIMLVAGVGFMTRSALTPSPRPVDPADRVTRDLDLLFAVIENRTTTSDSSDAASSEPEELTRFLIEGAS
jgi:hypothetical protein